MTDLVERFVGGDRIPAPTRRALEEAVAADPAERRRAGELVETNDGALLATVLDDVLALTMAPRRSRLERLLLVCRMPEPTARLVAATPALRWAWIAAVGVVLLFAAGAAGEGWRDTDRLAVLLALAPLVPVIGVAAAFSASTDPTQEVATAAAISGFRLLMIRTLSVLGGSIAVTLAMTLLSRHADGWLRVAWILPGLATTSATLVLATRTRIATAAGLIGCAWLVTVIVVSEVVDDAIAPYRWPGQLAAIVVTACASAILVGRRRHLDRLELR
jgi:hypothetical protein